ncbi:MAG: PadR family transcriptional regulator [Anaerolineaceae bacterium]|nr:PadR family transcriptional regulator [Anaerolineaceae bacterium]
MEFVILGLLSLRAMTVYEINKALERGVSLFYRASFGSINAAINKMINKGWIEMEEKIENGRNKKIYHLKIKGQQAFREWLSSEIETEKVKEPALTRLYFMGFSSEIERIRVLEEHVSKIHEKLDTLELIKNQSAGLQAPEGMEEVQNFQRLTLDYGIAFYKFKITWFQTLIKSLRNENKL